MVLTFTFVNYASFMMLLAFSPVLVAWFFRFVCSRCTMVLSALLAIASVLLLWMDVRVYALFKMHLSPMLVPLVLNADWREVFDFSRFELKIIATGVMLVLVFETGCAWWLWKKLNIMTMLTLQRLQKLEKRIAVGWFSGMVFCYFVVILSIAQNHNLFIQQAPNLPLFNLVYAHIMPYRQAGALISNLSETHYADALFSHAPLRYPRHPLHCDGPIKPYSLIVIMIDSLRFDALRHMPNVSRFGDTSWQFMHHLSGGNATQSGLFSLFYSIPSSYWTAALEQKRAPILMDVLRENGYTFHVFWSSEMHHPPIDKTVFLGVPGLASDGSPMRDVGAADHDTTQQALRFLQAYQHVTSPFFLNVFYDAAHAFCREQHFPKHPIDTSGECSRLLLTPSTDPRPLYQRYLNAVTFLDDEVGQLLGVIEKKGYLEHSIVVFTSDHGQAFNDHHQNDWGHASNYTQSQVHVPMLIHWPGSAPRTVTYVTSGYDWVPTLLTRLFRCHNNVDDYSMGQDLLTPSSRLPFVLAGSYVNMGVIESDRLTTLHASGDICISTLNAQTMPDTQPRMHVLHDVFMWMRHYYTRHGKHLRSNPKPLG